MKERPILMNAFSVRGILEGRKTQTRRVVKPGAPASHCYLQPMWGTSPPPNPVEFGEPGLWTFAGPDYPDGERDERRCPYGVVGDRLWVRETWGAPDADHPRCKDGRKPQPGDRLVYRADPADDYQWGPGRPSQGSFCWRPSIFIPRWASRLLLEVKDVRVERVQAISEEDAKAEGLVQIESGSWGTEPPTGYFSRPQTAFRNLWDSINAKPKPAYARDDDGKKVIDHYVSYPWEDIQETRTHRGKPWHVIGNPYVWCIAFKRI